jgi:hypothetical protein
MRSMTTSVGTAGLDAAREHEDPALGHCPVDEPVGRGDEAC